MNEAESRKKVKTLPDKVIASKLEGITANTLELN